MEINAREATHNTSKTSSEGFINSFHETMPTHPEITQNYTDEANVYYVIDHLV